MNLHAQRCLVIPDVHQDVAWVERILAREISSASEPDRIVFLGDYFDSRRPPEFRASLAATCVYLEELRARFGDRLVFLLGNHDVQYLEARGACLGHRTPRHLRYKCGSSFSHSAAKRIAKALSSGFWQCTRLFVNVNGWLLSHAGLAPGHFPSRATFDDSMLVLETACAAALQTITALGAPHPLLQAGRARGGDAPVGGVTWLDWDDEFADSLPMPQLVGHTSDRAGARQKGRSWCLDGLQTCYGVLTVSEFEVKAC